MSFDFFKFLSMGKLGARGVYKTGEAWMPEYPEGSPEHERQKEWNPKGNPTGVWRQSGYHRSWSEMMVPPGSTSDKRRRVIVSQKTPDRPDKLGKREYFDATSANVRLLAEDGPVMGGAGLQRRWDPPFVWGKRHDSGVRLVRRNADKLYDAAGKVVKVNPAHSNGLSIVKGPVEVTSDFDYEAWTGVPGIKPAVDWLNWLGMTGRQGPLWICTRQSHWGAYDPDTTDGQQFHSREDYDYLMAGPDPAHGKGFGTVGWRTWWRCGPGEPLKLLSCSVYTRLVGPTIAWKTNSEPARPIGI